MLQHADTLELVNAKSAARELIKNTSVSATGDQVAAGKFVQSMKDQKSCDSSDSASKPEPPTGSRDDLIKQQTLLNTAGDKLARDSGLCSAQADLCKCAYKGISGTENACSIFDAQPKTDAAKNYYSVASKAAAQVRLLSADPGSYKPASTDPKDSTWGDIKSGLQSGLPLASQMAMMANMYANQYVPQPQQMPTPPDPTAPCSDSSGALICGNAPASATTATSDAWPKDQAGFTNSDAGQGKGGFNTASVNDNPSASGPNVAYNPDPNQQQPMQNIIIPNNSGGTIPGNPTTGSATLNGGPSGGGGGYQAASASKTDVLHGEGGASQFAQTANGMSTQTGGGGGGGFSGYGGPEPIHLADYLPQGRHDPARAIAGATPPRNVEIQPKDLNIWNLISHHYSSRCTQGLLRDCYP